jgi:hypothetical protein
VGRLAHGLPLSTGGAASQPMCQLAWRSGCSAAVRTITSSGASAADVPPREPQANDWRGGRAAASTSLHPAFSGPAPGLADDWGGVRDARAPSEATCELGPIAKRASLTRSVRESRLRSPGTGKGRPCFSRLCRPDRVVSDGSPSRGETPVPRWLDAQRDSPAPRSGDTPRPTETCSQHHNAQHHSVHRRTSLTWRQPGSLFREIRVFRVNLLNLEV